MDPLPHYCYTYNLRNLMCFPLHEAPQERSSNHDHVTSCLKRSLHYPSASTKYSHLHLPHRPQSVRALSTEPATAASSVAPGSASQPDKMVAMNTSTLTDLMKSVINKTFELSCVAAEEGNRPGYGAFQGVPMNPLALQTHPYPHQHPMAGFVGQIPPQMQSNTPTLWQQPPMYYPWQGLPPCVPAQSRTWTALGNRFPPGYSSSTSAFSPISTSSPHLQDHSAQHQHPPGVFPFGPPPLYPGPPQVPTSSTVMPKPEIPTGVNVQPTATTAPMHIPMSMTQSHSVTPQTVNRGHSALPLYAGYVGASVGLDVPLPALRSTIQESKDPRRKIAKFIAAERKEEHSACTSHRKDSLANKSRDEKAPNQTTNVTECRVAQAHSSTTLHATNRSLGEHNKEPTNFRKKRLLALWDMELKSAEPQGSLIIDSSCGDLPGQGGHKSIYLGKRMKKMNFCSSVQSETAESQGGKESPLACLPEAVLDPRLEANAAIAAEPLVAVKITEGEQVEAMTATPEAKYVSAGDSEIGSNQSVMQVVESSFTHNLEEQVAAATSEQHNAASVVFKICDVYSVTNREYDTLHKTNIGNDYSKTENESSSAATETIVNRDARTTIVNTDGVIHPFSSGSDMCKAQTDDHEMQLSTESEITDSMLTEMFLKARSRKTKHSGESGISTGDDENCSKSKIPRTKIKGNQKRFGTNRPKDRVQEVIVDSDIIVKIIKQEDADATDGDEPPLRRCEMDVESRNTLASLLKVKHIGQLEATRGDADCAIARCVGDGRGGALTRTPQPKRPVKLECSRKSWVQPFALTVMNHFRGFQKQGLEAQAKEWGKARNQRGTLVCNEPIDPPVRCGSIFDM